MSRPPQGDPATIREQSLPQLTKILVVDDSEPFSRFARSLLQQMAVFEVAEAADGLEAVQKAKELNPELILLEWAKRCPNDEGESDIEIRQIWEFEDFASAFSPEEIQQE